MKRWKKEINNEMEEQIKNFARRNNQIIQILSIIILILLITFLIYFFFTTEKNAGKCLLNPVVYYQNLKNLTCSCVANFNPGF